VLINAGFQVHEACTGAEGLRLARELPADLVLLDVNLPDVSGLDVCRQLKSDTNTAAIPVLQMSATFTAAEHKVEGLQCGADAYLTEPVQPSELVATIHALLRMRRAEDSLRESLERERGALREAESANRAKDQFFAMLSHELRTPVNAILGWVHMLRKGMLDVSRAEHALEAIERNALREASLISELIDVTRITSGTLLMNREPVALAGVLRDAIESVQPSIAERGVILDAQIDCPATVLGDAVRLHQIVVNLLTNAIKFTPEGGRVQMDLLSEGPNVEVRVTDDGIGVAPDELPKLFEPFWQADPSSTRAEGGLGLGLTIVKHLVGLHGGSVRAESGGAMRGCRFVVSLPLAPLPDTHGATSGVTVGQAPAS
jgi:signal transduction histidine kinase